MTKINKKAVCCSFSRAASTYDAFSGLQREVAAGLVCRIEKELQVRVVKAMPGNAGVMERLRMLDIGAGTGALTGAIRGKNPDVAIIGLDISLPMLLAARKKAADDAFVAGDMEALPFASSSFDIAASSLAYQWAGALDIAFKEAFRVLKPGGLFAFSTLGPETLKELRQSIESAAEKDPAQSDPMPFAGPRALKDALDSSGFELICSEEKRMIKTYEDFCSIVRTLKNVGASPAPCRPGRGLLRGALLKKAAMIYEREFPCAAGGIRATYDVIFMMACKRI